jgi:hypothetical protein
VPFELVKNVVQIEFWNGLRLMPTFSVFFMIAFIFSLPQGRSEGGYWGEGGVEVNHSTFLKLTYSENWVGHSENHGNSVTKF